MTTITTVDLTAAKDGSYYTIIGAGGDLTEWIKGYEDELATREIGKPVAWFTTTGKAVNEFAHPANPQDAFQDDCSFLLFPLEGLNVGKLAIFKLMMQDRWFDDIISNIQEVQS